MHKSHPLFILSKNIINIFCTNHTHLSYYLKILSISIAQITPTFHIILKYIINIYCTNQIKHTFTIAGILSPGQKFTTPWFNINTFNCVNHHQCLLGGDIQTQIEFGRTIQLASTSRISLSEGSANCDNYEDDVMVVIVMMVLWQGANNWNSRYVNILNDIGLSTSLASLTVQFSIWEKLSIFCSVFN